MPASSLPPRAVLVEAQHGKPLRQVCIDLCIERGTISQPEIATLLGITRQQLWVWERIAGFSWHEVIAAVRQAMPAAGGA